MTITLGIDLGTTNCCVATIDHSGTPLIIRNQLGEATTPSNVSFVATGDTVEPVVGVPAQRLAATNPRHSVFGVKRLIGRRFDEPDVRELAATLPFPVVAAPNGDAWIEAQGRPWSPPQISALVLAELKHIAEHHFGTEVAEAIITVPAHFDNEQRRATRDAAEIAGLKVRRLLNEPTAAALGYGAHRGKNQRLAICDLGGGTFDVSIVNVEDGVIEVISTTGNLFLGGDDIDRAVIEQLVLEIQQQHDHDLTGDAAALQRLKAEVQGAKHALSQATTALLHLPYLAKLSSGPLDYERTLRRDELERWVQPVIARLEAPCREAVARCSLSPGNIDAIVLVGGMTRMPAVQAAIQDIFGQPPLKVVNPDEIVSIGAATQAAILDGRMGGVVLLDVTSRAIGLHAGEGKYQVVIPRNATIPTREHKIVATTEDGQREIYIDVFEGESEHIGRNRLLGRFKCENLTAAPAGEVMLMTEFTVDVDGILRINATEMGSGKRPEIRLVATAGLTRADVVRLSSLLRAPS